MFTATVIVSALLAAMLLGSAFAKFTKQEKVMESMAAVGVPADRVWMLATVETVGAIGLVAGLFWAPLGIAAAVGVVLYFVGAVIAHIRKKDPQIQPAAVLGLIAVVVLVFRIVSA
ncbi:DoxX family protein [Nakamurella silvestris]|nr:DoxX family protein [Nakamurella silvestris]